MIGPVRNHIAVLVKSELIFGFFAALFVFLSVKNSERILLAFTALMAVMMFIYFRLWLKTSYVFGDDGIESFKDTMYKNDKNIPYSKLASVNLVRNVTDLIFGTATLRFNVNSGVNAARPEIAICLKLDQANEIKAYVEQHLFGTPKSAETAETEEERRIGKISFGLSNVIFHGLFSIPTGVTLTSAILLGYAIISLFTDGKGGIAAFVAFVFYQVVPVITYIIRYYGFTIWRDGDTISVRHGLISTYSTSFDVSKINAVRVKRPFFARLMHMACLEAEVVGINAVEKEVRPVLCLLMPEERFGKVFDTLVPEFRNDIELQLQPADAKRPIAFKAGLAIGLLAAVIAAAGILIAVFSPKLSGMEHLTLTSYMIFAIVSAAVIIVAVLYSAVSSLRHKAFGCSDGMFVFRTGLLDRETVTMYYDLVQTVRYKAGPIARKYGICKCTISLLTAKGYATVTSGYFRTEDLRKIEERIFERIRTGEYLERRRPSSAQIDQ